LQICTRLRKLSALLDPVAVAVDVLSHDLGTPPALLWGVLGLSIEASSTQLNFIEVTLKTFESLLATLPRFRTYVDVLPNSPHLALAIQDVFQVYLDLGRRCVGTFGGKGLNFIRKLKWFQYQKHIFGDSLGKLRRLTDIVHKEAGVAMEERSQQIAEYRHYEIIASQQEVLSAMTRNQDAVEINDSLIFMVPHPPNSSFTGRNDELEAIHHTLRLNDAKLRGQKVVAICGLGGAGKSQLALKYVHQYQSAYKAVFWVTCDSVVKMDGDFASIAKRLGFSNMSLQQNRENVLNWLSKAGDDWLLIFDNVDSINDISDFWPRSLDGCIMLTSQNSNWRYKENVDRTILLKSLTSKESIGMLEKIMAKQGKIISSEAAAALVKETGGLPLAIRHIGSYICAMGTDPVQFLQAYQDENEASAIDAWDESIPSWYSHTLSTFLNYAFEKLTDDAIALLSTVCFLDPETIGEDVFTQEDISYGPCMSKNRYVISHFEVCDISWVFVANIREATV
ncbi:hypothetical protein K469DRAFT_756928, partial [Zopfia rhizophila CBS 207.26]